MIILFEIIQKKYKEWLQQSIKGVEIENYKMILMQSSKISELSAGKIDKYKYFTREEILPSNQSQTKISLLILCLKKHLKNKQRQLKAWT